MKLSRILPLVFGSAAGILASIASPAQALVVNVNVGGTSYDVTTVTGRFTDLQTQLQSQVWWQNQNLATNFANAVGSSYGLINYYGYGGPFFAYSTEQNFATLGSNNRAFVDFGSGGSVQTIFWDVNDSAVYAIATQATPVPFNISGGATIPTVGSLFALALMRKAKKSMALKNRNANSVSTTIS